LPAAPKPRREENQQEENTTHDEKDHQVGSHDQPLYSGD
jgi:hypothetical protein